MQTICPFPADLFKREENEFDTSIKKSNVICANLALVKENKLNKTFENDCTKPKIKRQTNFQFNLPLILVMMLFIPLISCTSNVKVTYFKETSGIFFENRGAVGLTRSSWNIIVHMDLEPYQQSKIGILTHIKFLSAAIDGLKREGIDESSLLLQLKSKFAQIELNDKLIVGNNPRRGRIKRAPLEFVGSIYHAMFGIMDAEHADILAR